VDIRAHVIVSGRVQGVGFRAWTQRVAQRHGVHGWVRNRSDRTVEAVFEGPRGAVEEVVSWCRDGSPASDVHEVDVDWSEPEGEQGFQIRY
jgi:acylphosphatase